MESPRYHPAERPPVVCSLCGALVGDTTVHSAFHAAQVEAAVHIQEAGQLLAVA